MKRPSICPRVIAALIPASLLLALPTGASAQEAQSGEFSVQRLEAAPGPNNIISTERVRMSQQLGWSAGFSTGEGLRGGFEYGYRNLFSSAVHASFRGQIGYQFVFLDKEIEEQYEQLDKHERIEYQTTLTFGLPYLRSLPKNAASVDLTVLADIQRDYVFGWLISSIFSRSRLSTFI